MVDINSIWEAFINGLNEEYPTYTYMKTNQRGNLPEYPFVTIGCIMPYKRDMDRQGGSKTAKTVDGITTLNVIEQPKMIFSFQAYSDNLQQCLKVLEDTVKWINVTNKQYLRKCGIVVVDVGDVGDRTSFLEVNYQYCWGFDITVRVCDLVSMEIVPAKEVRITNDYKTTIIKK